MPRLFFLIFIFLFVISCLENILKRQEKWRQKQIDTYYRRGRPIFLHGEYCKSRFVKLN